VEGSDVFLDPPSSGSSSPPDAGYRPATDGIWAAGDRVTWVAGLVLMLSSFMGWYSGSGLGVKLAVIGWHTGTLGKLVFFIGLAAIALVALREAGIELPPSIPESLVVIALGSLSTIFVLIRLISIPDEFLPASGRGIGIWISLLASLALIGAGLLSASEEL
jgi:hypothetical protein